jgi:hypothetical protein
MNIEYYAKFGANYQEILAHLPKAQFQQTNLERLGGRLK